jgi:hypothetical protein
MARLQRSEHTCTCAPTHTLLLLPACGSETAAAKRRPGALQAQAVAFKFASHPRYWRIQKHTCTLSTGRTLVSSIRCQSLTAPGPAPLWPRAHTLKWPMNPVRPPEFTCHSTTSPAHKGSEKPRKTPTPALRQCVVFYMDARCTPRPCICLTQQSTTGSVRTAPGCAHVAGRSGAHNTATQSSASPQLCTRWCPSHPSAVSCSVTHHCSLQVVHGGQGCITTACCWQ